LSPTTTSQLALSRLLPQANVLSLQGARNLLTAFDAGQGEGVELLALEIFEWLENVTEVLGSLADVDEDERVSEEAVHRIGRCAALAVHTHAAVGYQAARLSPLVEGSTLILTSLRRAERRYADLLLDTRLAARTGDADRLHDVMCTALEVARQDVAYLTRALGGQPDEVKAVDVAAVRAGAIARRLAMLTASCLHLMFRLTNNRKAAGLRQVAERRSVLARSSLDMLAATTQVQSAAVGSRVRLSARCEDVAWLDEGEGHTRMTVAAGEVTELRLPRRSAIRAGVAKGSWLYVHGELAEDGDTTYVEVDVLPTTEHAGEVWEDYLVTQVRGEYDLVPRSIDMGWELPDLREIGGRNDLYGRI
jgi:hypothetical protein